MVESSDDDEPFDSKRLYNAQRISKMKGTMADDAMARAAIQRKKAPLPLAQTKAQPTQPKSAALSKLPPLAPKQSLALKSAKAEAAAKPVLKEGEVEIVKGTVVDGLQAEAWKRKQSAIAGADPMSMLYDR